MQICIFAISKVLEKKIKTMNLMPNRMSRSPLTPPKPKFHALWKKQLGEKVKSMGIKSLLYSQHC